MIIRIFQVTVFPERREDFRLFFVETAIPLMLRQDGLVSLTPGLPLPDAPDEFSMVMVWRDLDALRAFAGEDWRQPHIDPSEEGVVKSRRLSHYELAPT